MLKHTTTYLVYINIARKYLLHKAFQLQRVKENFRKHQKAPGCHGSSSRPVLLALSLLKES